MTVRQHLFAFLRSQSRQAPSKEAVLELVQQHVNKQQRGLRRGWQVKAASWVKKVHVDRGDVKVGRFGPDGRFEILPGLVPRYVVPTDLDSFELKPYVAVPKPKVVAEESTAKDEDR